MHDAEPSEALRLELNDLVIREIGAIAKPDVIQSVSYTHLTLPTSDLV